MNKAFFVAVLIWGFFCGQGCFAQDLIRDTFVDESLTSYIGANLPCDVSKYNYQSLVKIPIVLNAKDTIRSRDAVNNTKYDFIVKEDVYYDGKCIVPQGTVVKGRLELVMPKGMNGIPAMMVFDDFEIPGIEMAKLKSYYVRRGFDLTLLVLPLKWALTILPPTGSLTNLIMGGPAKLSKNRDVTLYYYPEWNSLN